MPEILLVTNISMVPETYRITKSSVGPDGLWQPKLPQTTEISKDWLYWPRALESYRAVSVRPCFIQPSRWHRFTRLAAKHLGGINQSIDWLLAVRVLRQVRRNTILLATNNLAVATVLWLKRHKLIRNKAWCVASGLADRLEKFTTVERLATIVDFNSADRNLVWGAAEADLLRQAGLKSVDVLTFGIDVDFWRPAEIQRQDYVFSVGWDIARDYLTLATASPYPVRIATGASAREQLNGTSVEVLGQPTCRQLRELYNAARVVAIITDDRWRPSGQISVLQAMACGRPVVTSQTKGFWSDKLVSGRNCMLAPAGSVLAVYEAIAYLWEHPAEAEAMGAAARSLVEKHYPFEVIGNSLMRMVGQCQL